METFTWTPSYSSRVTRKTNTDEIKFGDNYSERLAYGINNSALVFNLSFNKIRDADVKAIDAFINHHNGKDPFIWNPPAPFNYQDSPNYVGTWFYSLGALVKQGSDIYQCIQTHVEPKVLGNALYWRYVTRLPMIFVCKDPGGSFDQFDANTFSLTFTQVFDPQ